MFLGIILSVILIFYPTILLTSFFKKYLKSFILNFSFSWFCAQYLLILFLFLSSNFLKFFGLNNVLQKSLIIFIFLMLISSKKILRNFTLIIRKIKIKVSFDKTLVFSFIFLFSIFFYKPHLKLKDGNIYTSPVYWDFQWHAPLIQNFAFGDNFPPQNESFAGIPITYHYFWGLLVAIYVSTGLDIVNGINFISILTLFFLFTTIIGVGEELFKSKIIGLIAIILTITSSSFRFIYDLQLNSSAILFLTIKKIMLNTNHPFGYNGNMFNMFYFLAERQMVFGIIFLLCYIVLVFKKEKFSNQLIILFGILTGLFFWGHLFITIMVFCSLLFLFLFNIKDKKISLFLLSFFLVFLIVVLFYKIFTYSQWFHPEIKNYPKINFNFPTMEEEYPFSIVNSIKYYIFGYGIKIIFVIIGIYLLFKENKNLFLIFLSIIIPTFILINTIQLSPLSIYDNHKWLKPMNVILDLLTAFTIYKLTIYKKKFVNLGVIIIYILFLNNLRCY